MLAKSRLLRVEIALAPRFRRLRQHECPACAPGRKRTHNGHVGAALWQAFDKAAIKFDQIDTQASNTQATSSPPKSSARHVRLLRAAAWGVDAKSSASTSTLSVTSETIVVRQIVFGERGQQERGEIIAQLMHRHVDGQAHRRFEALRPERLRIAKRAIRDPRQSAVALRGGDEVCTSKPAHWCCQRARPRRLATGRFRC